MGAPWVTRSDKRGRGSIISEERHIRGVSGGMLLSRYVQDAAAAGKKKYDEKRSGKIYCGGRFRPTLSGS
jgi:hypothetical protein